MTHLRKIGGLLALLALAGTPWPSGPRVSNGSFIARLRR